MIGCDWFWIYNLQTISIIFLKYEDLLIYLKNDAI